MSSRNNAQVKAGISNLFKLIYHPAPRLTRLLSDRHIQRCRSPKSQELK